jgi:hypothetical protein
VNSTANRDVNEDNEEVRAALRFRFCDRISAFCFPPQLVVAVRLLQVRPLPP